MMTITTQPVSRSSLATRRSHRNERALRQLMNLWEREPQVENESEETDAELMVMLSGMVRSNASSLHAD